MQLYSFPFHALGGPNQIQLYASDRAQAERFSQLVIDDVKEIEQKYSRYKEDSIVSRINAAAGKSAVEVDQDTAALIDYAQVCYEQSEGLFDITSGVLRRIWDFKQKILPSAQQVAEILPLVGWQYVEWRKPYIKIKKAGMQLDFGGFGKEYAVDHAATLLRASGVKSGLVNLGGDVRVLGTQPNGEPWRIGIVHPREPDQVISAIEVKSGAVATSGDYERYFELDGRRYCHILNPKTGFPVDSFQSVSVLAESCLIAGSASTIAMLFGEKRGYKFLQELGLQFLVVTSKGELKSC